ncbi:hypothetical protein C8R43DRAFT_1112641 [Mycena crocata]|nr:hypothetical protein C8R43DRAFT_1112641 [Mycena crocata]
MRLTSTFGFLASVSALAVVAAADVICEPGSCWSGGPANATSFGCDIWEGGVGAWETCGFEGADGCFTSPNQATGSGCTQWEGGVDAWDICGFQGAVICHACPAA